LYQTNTILENEKVKIVEVKIPVGDKMPMHTHGAYVSYVLNAAKVRITLPDGSIREKDFVKGVASYFDAGVKHSLENIGSSEVINLDIELKES
jgi:quercetin dioxygenase-like cupin family protein